MVGSDTEDIQRQSIATIHCQPYVINLSWLKLDFEIFS